MRSLQYKGSFGLVVYRRKVALLHRDDIPTIASPNRWCLIGGLAEDGETPLQTFVREAREEINAQSDRVIELGLFEVNDTQHGVFVMNLNDAEFEALVLGDEGQKFEFFSLSEAMQLPLTRTSQAYLEQKTQQIRQYVA